MLQERSENHLNPLLKAAGDPDAQRTNERRR